MNFERGIKNFYLINNLRMSKNAGRSSMLMIVMVLCTLTIIWTNYIFSQRTVTDLHEKMMQAEYDKIWWKDNYIILQELQRKEILWYIDTIKEEQPELIEEILSNTNDLSVNKYEKLNSDIINDLEWNTSIQWNTWALISIVEFSDMECPYCISQHNDWIINQTLETYWEKINYMYKNFPLPSNANAKTEAQAAKCVEKISWQEKYFNFIDTIYKQTKWGWTWYKIENLSKLAESMWVNIETFNSCLTNNETQESVEKEFMQWRMLWVESIPTIIIINNKTFEYSIIKQKASIDDIKEVINDISI